MQEKQIHGIQWNMMEINVNIYQKTEIQCACHILNKFNDFMFTQQATANIKSNVAMDPILQMKTKRLNYYYEIQNMSANDNETGK